MNYEDWRKVLITGNITKSQKVLVEKKIDELTEMLKFFNPILDLDDYASCGYQQDEDFDWDTDEPKETNSFYINLFRNYHIFNIIDD